MHSSLSEIKFWAISNKKIAVPGLSFDPYLQKHIGRNGLQAKQCWSWHGDTSWYINTYCTIYIHIQYIHTTWYFWGNDPYSRQSSTHSRCRTPFRYGWSLQQDSVYAFTGCGRDGEPVAWTILKDSGQHRLGRLRGTWYLFFLIQVPELDDSNSSRKLL